MPAPVFSVRFKDPRTKAMLQTVAEQTGRSMNDIVEQAVHDQLILLGGAIEQQLTSIVEALRSYRVGDGLEWMVTEFAEGEGRGDPLQARQLRTTELATRAVPSVDDAGSGRLDAALAAFKSRS